MYNVLCKYLTLEIVAASNTVKIVILCLAERNLSGDSILFFTKKRTQNGARTILVVENPMNGIRLQPTYFQSYPKADWNVEGYVIRNNLTFVTDLFVDDI